MIMNQTVLSGNKLPKSKKIYERINTKSVKNIKKYRGKIPYFISQILRKS